MEVWVGKHSINEPLWPEKQTPVVLIEIFSSPVGVFSRVEVWNTSCKVYWFVTHACEMKLLALKGMRWKTNFHRFQRYAAVTPFTRKILVLRLRMPAKDPSLKTKPPQGVQTAKARWSKESLGGALFPRGAFLQEMPWALLCDEFTGMSPCPCFDMFWWENFPCF